MAITGQSTTIEIETTSLLGMNDVSISVNGEMLDVTTFASGGWIEKMQGLKSATISMSGFYISDDAGQIEVETSMLAGTDVTMEVLLDGTNGWTGEFQIASFEYASTPSGNVTSSISLESTGALTQLPA